MVERKFERIILDLRASFEAELCTLKMAQQMAAHDVGDVRNDVSAVAFELGKHRERLDSLGKLDANVSGLANLQTSNPVLSDTTEELVQPSSSDIPGSLRQTMPQSDTLVKRTAILVGDSNTDRFSRLAKRTVLHDKRFRVVGVSNHKFADTVHVCSNILKTTSQDKPLFILHSGLNDILSMTDVNGKATDSLICEMSNSVRKLFRDCRQYGACLKICSIPEVVDLRQRRDWRYITFEVNCALRQLSENLGIEFIDLAPITSRHANSMAFDGIHYNRNGQLQIANALGKVVGSWLGLPFSLLKPSVRFGHEQHIQFKSSRSQRSSSLIRINKRNNGNETCFVPNKSAPKASKEIPIRKPRYSRLPSILGKTSSANARIMRSNLSSNNYRGIRDAVRGINKPQKLNSASRKCEWASKNQAERDFLDPWLPGCAPWI